MTLSRIVAVRTTPAISRTTAWSMIISSVLCFMSNYLEAEQHLTLRQPMRSRDCRLDRYQCQSASCSARDLVAIGPVNHLDVISLAIARCGLALAVGFRITDRCCQRKCCRARA